MESASPTTATATVARPHCPSDYGDDHAATQTSSSDYNALSSHLSNGPTIIDSSVAAAAIVDGAIEDDANVVDQSSNSYTTTETAVHWRHELWDFGKELMVFTKNRSWKKKVLTILIVTSSVYVVVDLIWLGHVHAWIADCVGWLSWHPALAVFLFLLLFVVCTFLFVPPAFLYFGAGFCFTKMTNLGFGVLAATLVCYAGSLIGATLAFYRARYMMRDVVVLFTRRFPIIRAADRAFARNGFRVMLLLRLCPIIPFNGLNYIGGVLSISTEEFTKALIGIVPAMMLWIYCGATSQILGKARLSDGGDGVKMSWVILLGSGIGFGVIALILTWRLAIKELTKEIAKDSAENWFRYKRHGNGTVVGDRAKVACHAGEGFEIVASQRMLDIENDEEVAGNVPIQRRRRSSILPYIGIDTHHLDDHYDPPEDDGDEEWFWLFA